MRMQLSSTQQHMCPNPEAVTLSMIHDTHSQQRTHTGGENGRFRDFQKNKQKTRRERSRTADLWKITLWTRQRGRTNFDALTACPRAACVSTHLSTSVSYEAEANVYTRTIREVSSQGVSANEIAHISQSFSSYTFMLLYCLVAHV